MRRRRAAVVAGAIAWLLVSAAAWQRRHACGRDVTRPLPPAAEPPAGLGI